jgi:hypothetical protein
MRKRNYIAIGLLALVGAACTNQRVDEAQIGVRYSDGWIEGKHFEKVVEPNDSEWVWNDHVYKLPARQITWISGPGEEADAPAVEFSAKGEPMTLELATRFFLNSNEEVLKPFFLEICQKFDCWDGAIGGQDPNDGWNRMLRETFGNPQQAVLKDLGLEFNGEDLRYNNETRDEFARRFAEEFADAQKRLIGNGDYFCGPGYVRGDDKCPNISVEVTSIQFADPAREGIRAAKILAAEQQSLAVEQEKAAQAQQRVNAAKATPEYERLNQAQAMVKCAENPECQLTIIVGGDGTVGVSVPAG